MLVRYTQSVVVLGDSSQARETYACGEVQTSHCISLVNHLQISHRDLHSGRVGFEVDNLEMLTFGMIIFLMYFFTST